MSDDDWLTRIKGTMAVDLRRFQAAGLSPKEQIEYLFEIPEVEQAFYLRSIAKRDRLDNWSLVQAKPVDAKGREIIEYVASYDLEEPDETRQTISFTAYDPGDAMQRVEMMRRSLVYEGPVSEWGPKD